MAFCEEIECPSVAPYTLRIGGPQPDEDDNSLVFTREHPCGVERDAAFSAVDAPLVRVATMRACLGAGMPDGSLVLLRGQVLALDTETRGPGTIEPLLIDPCQSGAYYSLPRVKLEISVCGTDPVIIDSDSEIVVPAGDAVISVLAPGPRNGGTGAAHAWVRGTAHVATPTEWTDATLRIFGCPCVCGYTPEGVLTEYIANVIDTTTLPNTLLVRPRRARRLEVSNRNNAGVAATVQTNFDEWNGQPLGSTLWPTGPATVNLVGAAPTIEIVGVAAGVNAYIRWEIR